MSEILDRFLDCATTDERVQFLLHRTKQSRVALFDEWSKDERLKATDVVALPSGFQAVISAFVCGLGQIVGSKPTFYVKPNPEWKLDKKEADDLGPETVERMARCVPLENGTYKSQRRWVVIKGPTALPAEKGIQALWQYGPNAESGLGRNRLVEISASEYINATASEQSKKAQEESALRIRVAETEAEVARAELEELRAELDSLKKHKNKRGKG